MDGLFQPIVQGGFAGMCVILLGIVFWMIRKLLDVLSKNTEAFAANTSAINRLNVNMTEQRTEIAGLKEEMYRRPCIAEPRT